MPLETVANHLNYFGNRFQIEHFGQGTEGSQKDPHGDLSKYLHLQGIIRGRAPGGSLHSGTAYTVMRPAAYRPLKLARMKSPFMRAMTSNLISFGQTASHRPILVQLPKSSPFACATMAMARSARSCRPCGNRPRWAILAPVNNAAAALGHMATQAPQPMQAAASMERSASSRRTTTALPSGALPVATEMYPPAAMMRSKAVRSTTRSLTRGNALARQGSR